MNELSTVAFTLTYVATLGVAGVMFLGQVLAFAALLALSGTVGVLAYASQALRRSRP